MYTSNAINLENIVPFFNELLKHRLFEFLVLQERKCPK